MISRGNGGKIVNIASVAGLVGGHPDYIHTIGYNASKGAVVNMTRDLATSWARYGINVNAIAPGWFPTKMSKALMERFPEQMLAPIPLRRFWPPEENQALLDVPPSAVAALLTGPIVALPVGASR